jgi:hypothetical protein
MIDDHPHQYEKRSLFQLAVQKGRYGVISSFDRNKKGACIVSFKWKISICTLIQQVNA